MQRVLTAAGIDLDSGPKVFSRSERAVRRTLLEKRNISHRKDDRLVDSHDGPTEGLGVVHQRILHEHIPSFVLAGLPPTGMPELYQSFRAAPAPASDLTWDLMLQNLQQLDVARTRVSAVQEGGEAMDRLETMS